MAANVETKPELITKAEKDSIWRSSEGKSESPSRSGKDHHTRCERANALITSVLTENGKQTETVLDSLVTQEAVTQVIEVGTLVTHEGTNTVLLQPQKQDRDWTFKAQRNFQ